MTFYAWAPSCADYAGAVVEDARLKIVLCGAHATAASVKAVARRRAGDARGGERAAWRRGRRGGLEEAGPGSLL